ncbi:hypothetical protein [Paraglaciecola marina]|uniref:hypothetical protein n=1 Tax=Paraglaciecola marina TaxID=2500157 RepID=UPI00105E8993|nr:hypothetical protein [Paraglaciecola marina]
MTKKLRFSSTIGSTAFIGVMVIALFGFLNLSSYQKHNFADCPENVAFQHSLPLSHPINRCAAQESQSISWTSWFTGHSSSYQFHFIDLLELLSRAADSSDKAHHH